MIICFLHSSTWCFWTLSPLFVLMTKMLFKFLEILIRFWLRGKVLAQLLKRGLLFLPFNLFLNQASILQKFLNTLNEWNGALLPYSSSALGLVSSFSYAIFISVKFPPSFSDFLAFHNNQEIFSNSFSKNEKCLKLEFKISDF